MIASEPGHSLGLVLDPQTESGITLQPGTVILLGRDEVRAFPPDEKDSIYLLTLTLWAQLVGIESKKYSTDTRLPNFTRELIGRFLYD